MKSLLWLVLAVHLALASQGLWAEQSSTDPKALAAAGRWAEAESVILALQEKRPLSATELALALEVSSRLNHWSLVVSWLKSIEASRPLTIGQRRTLSEAHLRAGDQEAAELVLEKLVSDHPADQNLNHQLAFLYLSRDRFEEGASVYSKYLEKNPTAFESLVNLALIEFRLQRTADALRHLGLAFEADFAGANRYFYRQLVRNMPPQGLVELAEDTKRALNLPQDGPKAHRLIAEEYENLARYENAIAAYEAYLGSVSDDGARYRLARLYFLAGNTQKSEEQVSWLISRGGEESAPSRLLGAELAVRSGDFSRAADLLGKLPAQYREQPTYNYVAGRIALDAEDFGKAESHLTQALNQDPEMIEAYFHLGQLYLRTGQSEKGRKMLAEFRNRQP